MNLMVSVIPIWCVYYALIMFILCSFHTWTILILYCGVGRMPVLVITTADCPEHTYTYSLPAAWSYCHTPCIVSSMYIHTWDWIHIDLFSYLIHNTTSIICFCNGNTPPWPESEPDRAYICTIASVCNPHFNCLSGGFLWLKTTLLKDLRIAVTRLLRQSPGWCAGFPNSHPECPGNFS